MSTAVAAPKDPMADFQAKLQERVRNDIRDLLPEDAVAALVQKAIEQEFFKPRQVPTGRWTGDTKEGPSWFVQEIASAAKPIMEQAVAKFLEEHRDVIDKAVADFLDRQNLAFTIGTQLTSGLNGALFQLSQAIDRLATR